VEAKKLGLNLNVKLYYDFRMTFNIVYFIFRSFNSSSHWNCSTINEISLLSNFIYILAFILLEFYNFFNNLIGQH